jgi:VanZ family protein
LSNEPLPSSSEGATPSAARLGALLRWLPVVVWATFISWFSTDAFSAHSTNSYIDPVLRFFFGELTPAGFRLAHNVVRKSAHTLEYAILGALTCRALTASGERVPWAIVIRTLAYCAAYALMDEAHQTLVPSRTGSPIDVVIDVTGATVGTLLLTSWRNRRQPRPHPT